MYVLLLDEEESTGEPSQHTGTVVRRHSVQEAKVHLFHLSIIEHVCQMVMNDHSKGDQLFKSKYPFT